MSLFRGGEWGKLIATMVVQRGPASLFFVALILWLLTLLRWDRAALDPRGKVNMRVAPPPPWLAVALASLLVLRRASLALSLFPSKSWNTGSLLTLSFVFGGVLPAVPEYQALVLRTANAEVLCSSPLDAAQGSQMHRRGNPMRRPLRSGAQRASAISPALQGGPGKGVSQTL